MKKERIEWLDVARGASILLVTLFHVTITLEDAHLLQSSYRFLNNIASPARMPLFFFVSGFLAASTLRGSWSKLFVKKSLMFLYLYVVWLILYWPVRTTILGTETASLPDYLLRNFVSPGLWLWFIYALAIYFPLTKLLSRLAAVVALLSLALSILVMGDVIHCENFIHNNILKYFFFFSTGNWYGARILKVMTGKPLLSLAVSAAIFLILLRATPGFNGLVSGIMSFVMALAAVMLGCSLSYIVAKLPLLKRLMAYLGRNTLPVYLGHYFVITILVKLCAESITGIPGIQYSAAPVLLVVAITLPLLFKAATDKAGAYWLFALPKKLAKHA